MRPPTDDFQFIAGNLSLDFVNTIGDRLGEAREYLTSPAELTRWARRAGILSPNGRLTLSPRQMSEIRTARESLYRLFQQLARGGTPSRRAVSDLNTRLESVAGARRLRLGTRGVRWEWLSRARDARSLLAQVYASAAELLVSDHAVAVRQCEGERCGWLFVDRSRSGHRRWCSMADCGNREKARRHLARVRRRAQ